MCKVGDIILIRNFKNESGVVVPAHPFVVVDDSDNQIQGFNFDLVGVLMSSFKNEDHKRKKLSYSVNVEITVQDGAAKNGFLKANQLHYFSKDKTNYIHLGRIDDDLFEELIKVIESLNDIITNLENLK